LVWKRVEMLHNRLGGLIGEGLISPLMNPFFSIESASGKFLENVSIFGRVGGGVGMLTVFVLMLVMGLGRSGAEDSQPAEPVGGIVVGEQVGEQVGGIVGEVEVAEAGVEGVVYAEGFDAGGFYLPNEEISSGPWVLDHLFLGGPMDVDFWREEGSEVGMIPAWMEFRHVESEMATNELGQEYAVNTRRVRASAIVVEEGRFEFRGSDEEVGEVQVSGEIHKEHLHEPGGMAHDGAAAMQLKGLIGGVPIVEATFMHWLGD